MIRFTLFTLFLVFFAAPAFAGDGYEITSQDSDGKVVTYQVNFGGGMMFEQHTAYDPSSKSFVYLTWKRNEDAPKPVCSIWDHATGRTIELYQFPGVDHPLPVIPSIKEMKVCPKTGDKNFDAKLVIAYD